MDNSKFGNDLPPWLLEEQLQSQDLANAPQVHAQAMAEIHRQLVEAAADCPEPDEERFALMRRGVRRRLQAQTHGVPTSKVTKKPWKLWFWPLAAAAALGVGFFAGRGTMAVPMLPLPEDHLLQTVRSDAFANHAFNDSVNSPLVYSNISITPLQQNEVGLEFDVTTHVNYVGSKDDPLVGELLVQSLLDPASLGNRLRALGVAGELMDPKIKEALVYTINQDPDLPVRLKALALLKDYLADPAVQEVVLDCLKNGDTIQIRLQALEMLAGGQTDPGAMENLLKKYNLESDPALAMKLKETL